MRRFGVWTLEYGVPNSIEHVWEFTRFENKTFNITTIEVNTINYIKCYSANMY